jgi:glucan phosphoethanolaminetransferase (alkaline phosphatase superfamily)
VIKIQEKGTILYYAMLYYVQINKNELVLVLTSNVSGYTNYIELYWAHLIYVMGWFGQWLIWIGVAQLESNMCKI